MDEEFVLKVYFVFDLNACIIDVQSIICYFMFDGILFSMNHLKKNMIIDTKYKIFRINIMYICTFTSFLFKHNLLSKDTGMIHAIQSVSLNST